MVSTCRQHVRIGKRKVGAVDYSSVRTAAARGIGAGPTSAWMPMSLKPRTRAQGQVRAAETESANRALGEGAADGRLDDRVRRVVHLRGRHMMSVQQLPGAVCKQSACAWSSCSRPVVSGVGDGA